MIRKLFAIAAIKVEGLVVNIGVRNVLNGIVFAYRKVESGDVTSVRTITAQCDARSVTQARTVRRDSPMWLVCAMCGYHIRKYLCEKKFIDISRGRQNIYTCKHD